MHLLISLHKWGRRLTTASKANLALKERRLRLRSWPPTQLAAYAVGAFSIEQISPSLVSKLDPQRGKAGKAACADGGEHGRAGGQAGGERG